MTQEKIPWTLQQRAFFERLEEGDSSIVLTSVAGSGKTTTLVEGVRHLRGSSLALAFNVRINKVLTEKIGDVAVCRTLNSLGHRALLNFFGRRVEIDHDKVRGIVRNLINAGEETWDLWSPVSRIVSCAKHHGLIPNGTPGLYKALLPDEEESWEKIASHYDINFDADVLRLARAALRKSNTLAWNGVCDFDDQIYICQPPGARVLMEKGHERNIEDISAGDKVVSYNRRTSKLIGFYNHASRVDATRKLHYSGIMYSVQTTGTQTDATAAHRWLVKLEDKKLWTVYLMRKGNSWRIGQTILWRKAGSKEAGPVLGAIARARSEHADAVWILTTASSLREAKVSEATLSAYFGISPHLFSDAALGTEVHAALGDVSGRAKKLLRAFKRHELLPLWPEQTDTREDERITVQTSANTKYPCLVRSCNLVKDFMLVPEIFGEEVAWHNFEVYDRAYVGPVHSIQIHRHSLYVADRLLTHNSTCWGASFDRFDNVLVDEAQDLSEIQHSALRKALKKNGRLIAVGDPNQAVYGFRAAMSDSIERLKNGFGLEEMPLTISFRCAKNIVREAQRVVPRIESAPDAPLGIVDDLSEYWAASFASGDVILCRNNAPLIKLAYRLIGSGCSVCVVGRDIGVGLKLLVRKLTGKNDNASIEFLGRALRAWHETEISKASAKSQWSKVSSIDDKAESLGAIINGSRASTAGGVIKEITELFGKSSAPITLSTIHRAKGLEWPHVYFLDRHLLPSIWAVKACDRDYASCSWMLQEEQNLIYVGITRAMQWLTYITSEGWKGYELAER